MREVKIGRYRHYKNLYIRVIGVARHSETQEEMVVYKEIKGNEVSLWVRPKKMFLEMVEVNGKKVPRFEYLGDE